MSDTQKPVEVPKTDAAAPVSGTTVAASETAPVVAEPPKEAEPVAAATTAQPETTAEKTTTEPEAAATTDVTAETPAVATEEAKKEAKETKPVEEGYLESKGSKFPQNFIYTKRFFWFGNEAVEPKALASFIKSEKSTEGAQNITAWASHTGEGLLFFTEKGTDKSAPNGAIQLSEASEPTADGPTKFHFTTKGHKHTFKAATAADRDNWVAQIKAKSEAAKAQVATVTESENYKKTLESFKPAPPVGTVKKEEAKADEAVAPAVVATEAEPAAGPKETEVPKTEERAETKDAAASKDEKKEESQRRSASRKRASIFGSLLGKKDEKKENKKDDVKPEDAAATAPVETATEAPAPETAAPAEVPAIETPAAVEGKKDEEKAAPVKPTPVKRNSLFGNLSFGKKKSADPAVAADAAPASPAKDVEAGPVADAAPVIPAMESSAPLSAEVASPATVPTETVEGTAATSTAAINGEPVKKEMKSEKRKSSLPFAFGKKDKATSSDEEGDKAPKSPSAFSKLRATIKGKNKTAEKPAEKPEATPEETADKVEPEATKSADTTEVKAEEAGKPVEAEAAVAEEAPKPVAAAPVVAASA